MARFYRFASPVGYAKSIGVRMGENCYINCVDFGSEPYLITLGDNVGDTDMKFVTHDGAVRVFRGEHPDLDIIAPIKVGNNIFLGIGVIVMPGGTIGDNVVIGAGAVVTKDIPSNCVAAGIPAKPIKSIDEYWKSVESKTINTRRMRFKEKKKFLIDNLGLSNKT